MNSDLGRRLAFVVLVLSTCSPVDEQALHPTFPNGGLLRDAVELDPGLLEAFPGSYSTEMGYDRLGRSVVMASTTRTVSVFAKQNSAYMVLRAGCIDGGTRLVLEGSWRYANTTDAGLVRLFVGPPEVAQSLCGGSIPSVPLELSGAIGEGTELPDAPLLLRFRSKPKAEATRPFYVIAHRGGCRTSDDCGASENSSEVIRLAESLGANAVEVDVRTTRDGVPILYHDDDFNPRLVKGQYCHGPVEDFTFPQVRALCKLAFGEQIPTLDDALRTLVDDTTLQGMWMDIKKPSAVVPAAEMARKTMALARERGRNVSIVTGLGDQDVYGTYVSAGLVDQGPCLVELEPADVRAAGCEIFAPRWTRGPMPETVRQLQAEARLVAFWTLDEVDFIDSFLRDAVPNGLLTNRPGLVYHRFQTIGTLPPPRPQP